MGENDLLGPGIVRCVYGLYALHTDLLPVRFLLSVARRTSPLPGRGDTLPASVPSFPCGRSSVGIERLFVEGLVVGSNPTALCCDFVGLGVIQP